MLLYITTGEPRDREVRPLHTVPETMTKLFYMSMREHSRPAVLRRWKPDGWEDDPDWRFDRQVIRTGIYLRERLRVAEGDRVAVSGVMDLLWVQVDLAVQALRAIPVGMHDGLSDDGLAAAIVETGCKVAFATDATSGARLLKLLEAGHIANVILPAENLDRADGAIQLSAMRTLSETLDTPERARQFHNSANAVSPQDPAGIHFSPGDGKAPLKQEFTHEQAMRFVKDRTGRCPAQQEDFVFFETRSVTVSTRLSYQTAIGDGYTALALPEPGTSAQIAELEPAKIVASAKWIESLCTDLSSAAGNGRGRKMREALRQRVGKKIRWIEPAETISADCEKLLVAGGLPIAGRPIQ
ncbi:MAG: AMP-binding protein [Gemmatimonadales bacterium]